MLVRLMYASRAAETFDDAALQAILKESEAKNPPLGVTGVLCYSSGLFLQVLEGGRTPVNSLYNLIIKDERHTDVVLLSYEEIEERSFGGWSMGQVNLSRVNRSLVLKYSETGALDPYSLSGRASMALLKELVATASVKGLD
jgi:hypothetical protein